MRKELTDQELDTYSRQIVLADIGYDGQLKLRNANTFPKINSTQVLHKPWKVNV